MSEEIQTPISTPPPPQPDPKHLPPWYGFIEPNGEVPMFPFPPQQQGQEHGAGIYAVPTFPNSFIAGFPSNPLIPFTYNVPATGPSPTEAGTGGDGQGQVGQQQGGQQRQVVVRRFQIAIHLDLMLMAAVIFLFNQDGSRKRLVLLIFFASLIYLYQTGALAPLIRWLSQGMQRAAAAPPQQLRPAVRADNIPAAARQENENAPLLESDGGENENQVIGDANQAQNEQDNVAVNGRWWGIVNRFWLHHFSSPWLSQHGSTNHIVNILGLYIKS